MKHFLLFFAGALVFFFSATAQITPGIDNIIYVNRHVAGGNGSGSSWQNAVPELADALKWAKQNEALWSATNTLKIFVALGTYYPKYSPRDGANFANEGRDNAFLLVKNVQLYGGFDPANGITQLSHNRIFMEGATRLSGDHNNDDVLNWDQINNVVVSKQNQLENAYHVVIAVGNTANSIDNNTVLDGFTISGGNANGNLTITINGKIVERASAGGIYNNIASPLYRNLVIAENLGSAYGAAMANFQSNPELKNVLITKNAGFDGTIYNRSSNAKFTNVEISLNSSYYAGAMYNVLSNVTITNATITNNGYSMFVVNRSAIIHNAYSNPVINNSIIFNNFAHWIQTGEQVAQKNIYNQEAATPVIKHSFIGALATGWSSTFGTDDGNNIVSNTSPFALNTNKDFTLGLTSEAIDKGSNALYNDTGNNLFVDKDLSYNSRLTSRSIDMGAYELQNGPLPVVYAKELSASVKEQNVLLSWTTAHEHHTKGFAVERSTNGKDFEQIDFVQAKGSGTKYHYQDNTATLSGKVYYRLAEIGLSGEKSLSNIVAVEVNINDVQVKVYPNPATSQIAVNATGLIQIYDMSGRLVLSKQSSGKSTAIDISNLARGAYILKAGNKSTKFIKQ